MPETLELSQAEQIGAAEYLLDLLSPEDRAAFLTRLAEAPALAQLVEDWAGDPAAMAEALEELPASDRLRRALLDRLRADDIAPRGLRGFIASLGIGELVIGTATAVALAFLAWEYGLMETPLSPGYEARLEAAGPAGETGYLIRFNPDTARLILTRDGPSAPQGAGHQLWLLAGDAVIPLLLWPEGETEQRLDLPAPVAALAPGATIAVTLEPLGGVLTQPQGPTLAEAELRVLPE
ncbi:Anti-sigma-K factor RskA [Pseudooceanicola antarcticus]|uniref:Anti-sigma-K factor RskA n=2 Tax=Pseudooceanicola antarcticus TaxID=1247613 RepID=A0A285J2W5_9RHOB|nr:hypothetical protein CVM39_07475 [Pseudooceanicola antarcticus]SNY54614.1 Anti-sigma-K factor RskA [Pseudooceanicola antarcticus]